MPLVEGMCKDCNKIIKDIPLFEGMSKDCKNIIKDKCSVYFNPEVTIYGRHYMAGIKDKYGNEILCPFNGGFLTDVKKKTKKRIGQQKQKKNK